MSGNKSIKKGREALNLEVEETLNTKKEEKQIDKRTKYTKYIATKMRESLEVKLPFYYQMGNVENCWIQLSNNNYD